MNKSIFLILTVCGLVILGLLLTRQVLFAPSVEDVNTDIAIENMKRVDGKCACSFLVPLDWSKEDESGIYDVLRQLPAPADNISELEMGETFFTIGWDSRDKETILFVYKDMVKDYPEMRTSFLLIGGELAARYDYYSQDKTELWRSEFYIFPRKHPIVSILTDFPELPTVQAMLLSLRFE